MRVSLNLASRPYVELGPLYARLRVLIAGLAVLALPLWFFLHMETRKASEARARLVAIQQQTDALRNQQQSFQSQMQLPDNAAVLREAQFLNQTFQRKAFSWTAVMMDLEKVLPAGVQVLNIDPVISRSGDVTIHLRVNGDRSRAVELVRNLEHSRSFLSPRLASETAETTSQAGRGMQPASSNNVNFDILSEYNPLPPTEKPKHGNEKKTEETQHQSGPPGVSPGSHPGPQHPVPGRRPAPGRKAGPQ
jgi:type IV pilus assembly protein PilN